MSQSNSTNQVFMMNVPVPALPRMNFAEVLGIESAFQEVQRAFEPFYGTIPHPLNGYTYLRCAIYWSLREIDTLVQQGNPLQTILGAENQLRHIARAACNGSQNPNEQPVLFENRPFQHQILYMNLVLFLIRYLLRVQPVVPVILNSNAVGAQPT